MNKEQLAAEAARQYDNIRRWSEWEEDLINIQIKPDPYRSERETRRLYEDKRSKRTRLTDDIFDANREVRQFYREHHAELYDLAREEMEADGHTFSEGDPYAVTAYYFSQEIADIERESPLDALGAKIVHITQSHIDCVNEELSR